MPCDTGLSGESSLAEAGLGVGVYSSNEGGVFSEDPLGLIIWETKISGLPIGKQNPGTGGCQGSAKRKAGCAFYT